MDRPRRNYGHDHAKALRHELLRAEVPRRLAPQRGTPIQRLAHRPGAADAHLRGYWHAGGGEEQSQALSRRTRRTSQAAVKLLAFRCTRCRGKHERILWTFGELPRITFTKPCPMVPPEDEL